jgi:flagellar biosynthesis/type III secretory pathway M-ring protein FliF/YscJ
MATSEIGLSGNVNESSYDSTFDAGEGDNRVTDSEQQEHSNANAREGENSDGVAGAQENSTPDAGEGDNRVTNTEQQKNSNSNAREGDNSVRVAGTQPKILLLKALIVVRIQFSFLHPISI